MHDHAGFNPGFRGWHCAMASAVWGHVAVAEDVRDGGAEGGGGGKGDRRFWQRVADCRTEEGGGVRAAGLSDLVRTALA